MTRARKPGDPSRTTSLILLSLLAPALCLSCSKKPDTGADSKVTALGSIEVTAKLLEIKGDLPNIPMYDYAFVMKYQVLQVHRGKVDGDTVYVGHYNPLKPRAVAADARAPQIGGSVKKFKPGDIHRMALEVPIDDYYMGGIINRYFEESKAPIYWALWTNSVVK